MEKKARPKPASLQPKRSHTKRPHQHRGETSESARRGQPNDNELKTLKKKRQMVRATIVVIVATVHAVHVDMPYLMLLV